MLLSVWLQLVVNFCQLLLILFLNFEQNLMMKRQGDLYDNNIFNFQTPILPSERLGNNPDQQLNSSCQAGDDENSLSLDYSLTKPLANAFQQLSSKVRW